MLVEIVIPQEYLSGDAELSRVIKQFNADNYSVEIGQKIILIIDNRIRKCIVIDIEDLICSDLSTTRIIKVVAIDETIKYKYDENMI